MYNSESMSYWFTWVNVFDSDCHDTISTHKGNNMKVTSAKVTKDKWPDGDAVNALLDEMEEILNRLKVIGGGSSNSPDWDV